MGNTKSIFSNFKSKIEEITEIQKVYIAPSVEHITQLNDNIPCVVISDVSLEVESISGGAYTYDASVDITIYSKIEIDTEDTLSDQADLWDSIKNKIEDLHTIYSILSISETKAEQKETMISKVLTALFTYQVQYKNH